VGSKLQALIGIILFFSFDACAVRETPPVGPAAVVSILPQRWFVERIAGGRFPVTVLSGPGQNPHNMEEARQERVAAIFVQAQFPLQTARILAAALNMETVPLDPLSPDWLANIRVMGEALKKSLSFSGRPAVRQ
jgi:ABC-type Zn uptake system ZnuABC Zn-binding protein ZnuA